MENLLETADVTRISVNHARDFYKIYVKAKRLIFKKNIWKLEESIKKQIFKSKDITVKIIESYELSSQYTPKTLFDVYFDSILDEINSHSVLLYNLLRTSKWSFTDDTHVTVTLEETIIAKTRGNTVIEFLEKVFCERCGMDFIVNLQYEKPKISKYRQNADKQIEQEVQNIVARTKFAMTKDDGDEDAKVAVDDGAMFVGGSDNASGTINDSKTGATKVSNRKKEAKTDSDSNSRNNSAGTDKKPEKKFEKKFEKRFERKGDFRRKYDNDPDIVYGRSFDDEEMSIEKIDGPIGEVTIKGKILTVESREIRNEKTIIMFAVTDFTDTIMLKLFTRNDDVADILAYIAPGNFVKAKGVVTVDKYDSDLSISSIVGLKKIPDFTSKREDTAAEKRVELHCHTKMSDMDGVSDVKDIVKCAMRWGHKAIAITDHGDVQAFPDANHTVDDKFKVIYGVEAYLVDDTKDIVENAAGQSLDDKYVVFDIETTGFSPEKNKIIEIGAVKVIGGEIVDRYSTFINPEVPIPFRIEELTSIRDDMVITSPTVDVILPQFMEFCKDCIMVAHNADFDMSFIKRNCALLGMECNPTIVDTVALARVLLPQLNRFKLDTVAKALNISLDHHHRAVDDAACTAEIFVKFIEKLKDRGISSLDEVNALAKSSVEMIRKMPTYHAIILATCDQGRTNLYRLISLSHIKYYNKRPRIPKSEFNKYRDGLLIGSACEAGELYRAILNGRPQEEITRLVNFYDYLEIQPLGNNAFMIRDEDSDIASNDDLIDINKRIVKLGEEFGKLVVATCDVHFLNPEDEVYRRIIMAGKGFKDADEQAPLYLRTTEEMLKEFEYLGSKKAEEVVITNTNKIADMCERISPVRPDKCPPVIENSDGMLREICYNKANRMYGDPLPPIVKERLDRELNSIISNGYAVMYIIAQKLVWKSVEDGYLVGSRGSVGSSFVATMAGITEVNPLSPHYYCSKCHYVDFDSDEVKAYAGKAGIDMPDKVCPVCGEKLHKDGFDIPFETFLGFKGDKEPDIDLNFSGEYQSKAHKYTEVIFGAGQTFRAGTIATLADKTAFGYVKNYFEERGIHKRTSEIDRIASGCTGVRRSTGQHPGGIVVLPLGQDINSFTPVQHPANDMTTDTITTHFDYHSIDHNLLKLDILGHDDPTMIRMLQDLTGRDPLTIPLDGQDVMSLFQNTDALGITPEQIGGTKLGALGIPEFGTDFAMQMVIDAKPKAFSDLVRISGLSHGTNVWLGNAQDLIMSGVATISTAICTRDDIMLYLIQLGVESEKSFKIMEAVRKGMVAKGRCAMWEEWKEDMLAHNVPQWYIESCQKIEYMFPKAHAAAYVMMAWRIAYCKIHYPLAYYGAFFSIRAKAFSYEIMCQGQKHLESVMVDYKKRQDTLSNKEKDAMGDMRIVPIDIFRAQSRSFQIVDGKLMPSLNSIDGLGEKAADAIVEAAKDGPFLSKDDFRQRTKVSKTIIDLMDSLGLLGDLPESNQISIFDLV